MTLDQVNSKPKTADLNFANQISTFNGSPISLPNHESVVNIASLLRAAALFGKKLARLVPGTRRIRHQGSTKRPDTVEMLKTACVTPTIEQRVDAAKHVGPLLAEALGKHNVSILQGATNDEHMNTTLDVLQTHGLKAELILPEADGSWSTINEQAFNLYKDSFTPNEVVPVANMKQTLTELQKSGKHLSGDYYAIRVTCQDPNNPNAEQVVAFTQGGVVSISQYKCAQFSEYGVVRKDRQKQGIQNVYHCVSTAISKSAAITQGKCLTNKIGEIEQLGQGTTAEECKYSSNGRPDIYAKKGWASIFGVDKAGKLVPLHVQPKLQQGGGSVPLDFSMRELPPLSQEAAAYANACGETHLLKNYQAVITPKNQIDVPQLTIEEMKNFRNGYDKFFSRPGRGLEYNGPEINESRKFFDDSINSCVDIRYVKLTNRSICKEEELPGNLKNLPNKPTHIEQALGNERIAQELASNYNIVNADCQTEHGRLALVEKVHEIEKAEASTLIQIEQLDKKIQALEKKIQTHWRKSIAALTTSHVNKLKADLDRMQHIRDNLVDLLERKESSISGNLVRAM